MSRPDRPVQAAHAGYRALCVVADDFGLHPAVNEAVLQLVVQGRVTAVSVMAAAPAWPRDAARLRQAAAGRADVGLHLDLTACPVQPALRRPLPQWVGATLLHAADGRAIEREIRQQLSRFEQAWGGPPDHVDGHQHVHQLPMVRERLLAVLRQRYAGRLPWVRSTRQPRSPGAGLVAFKPWVIEQLGAAALARLARRQGFVQNGRLLGVYGFEGDAARYLQRLQGWLALAQPGDLLMCHPAVAEVPGDAIAAARVAEFEALSSPATAALLAAAQVSPTPLRPRGWPAAGVP